MLSRRALVGRIASGAAVACVAGVGRASAALARKDVNLPSGLGNAEGRSAEPFAHAADASAAPAPASAVTSASPATVVDAGPPATASAPPPWELLHPLTLGQEVGHGWRVEGLTGVTDGVSVLTLRNARGRTHRVHLCRNDGRPQGLIYTKRFDLVVMNGGAGDLPTEEGLAQAVAKVARVLRANERNLRQASVVAGLLPHAERVRRFAGPVDRRLR
jgi:hypothetical protein